MRVLYKLQRQDVWESFGLQRRALYLEVYKQIISCACFRFLTVVIWLDLTRRTCEISTAYKQKHFASDNPSTCSTLRRLTYRQLWSRLFKNDNHFMESTRWFRVILYSEDVSYLSFPGTASAEEGYCLYPFPQLDTRSGAVNPRDHRRGISHRLCPPLWWSNPISRITISHRLGPMVTVDANTSSSHPSGVWIPPSLVETSAVFVDVFCPLVPFSHSLGVGRGIIKLISEGTAFQTERSFIVALRYLLVPGVRSVFGPLRLSISYSWNEGPFQSAKLETRELKTVNRHSER